MVAEADESDGSFLKMKPTIAVVTNIDREHLDHYAGLDAIRDAFTAFLARVPFYGAAIVCSDDEHVRAILPRVDRTTVSYGEERPLAIGSNEAAWAENRRAHFAVSM